MAKNVYSYDEIMAEHDYAQPHEVMGKLLHGGFDAEGNYISPRMLHRGPAVAQWASNLEARGGKLIDASQKLLKRDNYPNHAQQKFLLQHGLGKTLWDSLTLTGIIEGRGKVFSDVVGPDFQEFFVEDISELAVGHLNKGLHHAHGRDEGGMDNSDIGAHDEMWFVVRDLLFGKDAFAIPTAPEEIGRPEMGRLFPQISKTLEEFLLIYMNILMVEVRAEKMFSFCCELFRDPEMFTDRRDIAEQAAQMVERIRQDETIHVGYLQAVLSEMRTLTFKTVDGGTISGSELLDPVWEGMVAYHSTTVYDTAREQTRASIVRQLEKLADSDQLIAEFDRLETPLAAAAE
ncbi:MAG TPA: hypothetical protein DCZ07_04990 [Alphaproteobacteria bacterium]|nr:hypothetical protein [Alphaproteobacteria bacterium]